MQGVGFLQRGDVVGLQGTLQRCIEELVGMNVDRMPARGEIRLVRTVFHLLVRMEPRRKGAATVNTGCLSACIRVKWRVKLRQGGITALNGNSLDG